MKPTSLIRLVKEVKMKNAVHTREFQKVELEDACHNRDVVLLEQIIWEPLAGVDLGPKGVGL